MKTIDTFAPLACVAVLLTQTCLGQNASAGRPPTTPGQVHPPVHFRWGTTEPAATLAPTGFSPAQIRQAYGFDQLPGSVDGTGQTIAIIDAFGDGYVTGTTTTGNGNHKRTTTTIADATGIDWTNFCNQFGLPTDGLTVAYPQGPTTSTNWSLETALDIEWAHAIAPGAKILLVVASSNFTTNLLSAVDYAVNAGANVVSMSWGGSESVDELSYDAHFNHPGVTFVASSGDGGEPSSDVLYPAASPYVLSVGGTQLTNNNGIWSETAWSGSGGGISPYEPMPAFQNGWQQFPTGNMRSLPDVCYQGGPNPGVSVYVTSYGGWIQVYGTSVGTPQWAALIALANSARAPGLAPDANAAIYSIAGTGTTPPNINGLYFFDIISGTNGSDPDDAAIPGYDFVTGLGSPAAINLVPALSSWVQNPDFSLSVSPAAETVPTAGGTTTYTVGINRLGGFSEGVNLSVAASPALPGASASFSPNPATADSSTLNLTVPAATAAGTYALTITGVGAVSGLTRTAGATLVVVSGPTTVSVASITYSVSGGNKHSTANLLVTLALEDNLGQPVAGASVSTELYLNGSAYGSGTGTTLSNGTVTFQANNAPLGTYTTRIINVTASGLSWDGITPSNSYAKTQ